jgi:hypothetical protein
MKEWLSFVWITSALALAVCSLSGPIDGGRVVACIASLKHRAWRILLKMGKP